LYEYCQNKRTLQINSNNIQLKHQQSTQAQATEARKQTTEARTQTHSSTGYRGKKLVMVEICACVENSAVEKQAAAQQISPTSNTLTFKHSQALAHAACAV